ncbi:type VII secretion-associated serine protease mycosin [Polymorphospora sp. NPDC051019]|uniref:type VII secretion-associated serine protease mycosin n=1 Tax=Polymorphospora sp. NPDC051019 TaxID=3155725 RepID=UPI0034331FB6
MPGRPARFALTGTAVGAALVLIAGPPPAAVAAPACTAPPTAGPVATEVPWAQQRFGHERLAPLATGAGVIVAVIDSGVDRDHPQLADRVLRGVDRLDAGGDGGRDCVGHGTAVASIIAAAAHDGTPFRGLAPGAAILPVRISEQQIVHGEESGRTVDGGQFAAAIRWAADHGADVLNLSVVLYRDDPAVRAAVAYAAARDVVLVAAAGNLHDDGDPLPYPAAYDGVLGVGAIAADGSRAPFSQTGAYVDVVAPGAGVLAAAPERGHRRQDGTSYAAPFVAATAALIREYRPDLSAAEVAARIVATADPAPAGGTDGYGAGVVNPHRAVTETGAVAWEQSPAALPGAVVDPATAGQRERRDRARDRAVLFAGAGAAAAITAVLLSVVLPRGLRRRWRPAGPPS